MMWQTKTVYPATGLTVCLKTAKKIYGLQRKVAYAG